MHDLSDHQGRGGLLGGSSGVGRDTSVPHPRAVPLLPGGNAADRGHVQREFPGVSFAASGASGILRNGNLSVQSLI